MSNNDKPNMNNLWIDRLEKASSAIFCTCLAGVGLYAIFNPSGTIFRILLFAAAALAAACFIIIHNLVRRDFINFSDQVCQNINSILVDTASELPTFEDSLDDKINAYLQKAWESTRGLKEEADAQKSSVEQLVSDISHQLKTPMTNLRLGLDAVRSPAIPADHKEQFLAGLDIEVDKMEFLIGSLIKTSRLETGIIIPKPEVLPIWDTIHLAVDAANAAAFEKQIEIEYEYTELEARHDPRWTTEALSNVIGNAVKYSNTGGKVRIWVTEQLMYIRIRIADTGIGIKPENQTEIFKRFFRENRMPDAAGVGVGLSLTREILAKQKGYITVNSKVDEGTTFSIFLPVK